MNVPPRHVRSAVDRARAAVAGRHVAVVSGPVSPEDALYHRETPVEQWSSTVILRSLESLGCAGRRVDPTGPMFPTRIAAADVALINVHGPGGEDGVIQGLLEMLEVPYTTSGVLAGAVGAHKPLCKRVVRDLGVPTPRWWSRREARAGGVPDEAFPVMVKAIGGGSSVGLGIADTPADLPGACAAVEAAGYAGWFVEAFVAGTPVTAATLDLGEDTHALPVITCRSTKRFYDEESKLRGTDIDYVTGALPEDVEVRVRAHAVAIHEELGCRDVTRSDFVVDEDGTPWFLELNTVPGMLPESNLIVAAREWGLEHDDVLAVLLDRALRRGRTAAAAPREARVLGHA